MINSLKALYFKPATLIVYMLQSTEYEAAQYFKWFWRTQDFSRIMHRRTLDLTKRAILLRRFLQAGMALQIVVGIGLCVLEIAYEWFGAYAFGMALLLSYPIVWAHVIVIPLLFAKYAIVMPKDRKHIAATEKIFAKHPGVKIAVLGSYGKTTMKELLTTILNAGLKAASTPGNKNVSVSHASFARKLDGDEDVLIIEYGEGQPGDITRFAKHTHPTHAVVTGLAAAHLDKYKTIDGAAEDIFSIREYVDPGKVYLNGESPETTRYALPTDNTYTAGGLGSWKVSKVQITIEGTRFLLSDGKQKLQVHSGLLGKHQIGPLTAGIDLALELGLQPDVVIEAVATTKPFQHRLQPYRLGGTSGAWIIDDTYNGNLEGVRAGTDLLRSLEAKRKWYITPGLVEQGKLSAKNHKEVGRLIAAAKPDIVVLMQNSATVDIKYGLEEVGYSGELRTETDPLAFYTNLEQFVAAGDVVLMQNDWTDNYS